MRLLVTVLAIGLSACSVQAKPQGAQPFGVWLDGVRAEAVSKGIRRQTAEAALSNISLLPRVVELDRAQPESKLTLDEYLRKVLPPARVLKARQMYHEYLPTLRRISAQYGVQPEYIVALWGLESGFGQNMGNFNVVESLATLAYDGRRPDYFRGELLNALRIIDQGHISVGEMTGSWAGAMGQCQFMPTSFLRYAVDENRDGHKDIWGTEEDVFASIANYLHKEGWKPGQRATGGKKHSHNFKVLMKWNRSTYFATSVGMLAAKIKKP